MKKLPHVAPLPFVLACALAALAWYSLATPAAAADTGLVDAAVVGADTVGQGTSDTATPDTATDAGSTAPDVTAPPEDPLPIVINASETTLADWLWIKRPVVVFADSPADPRFQEQIALLTERYAALEERDVVIIADSDPAAQSTVRRALRPRGFGLVIMAKDGSIVARKPTPWSVREISRSIDKLPLRQDELKGF